MQKLVVLLIAAALLTHGAAAQTAPGQPTTGPANTAGVLYASVFGLWTVPQGNTGQFSWSSPSFCTVAANGIPLNPVFAVGTPIYIRDSQNPANSEIVTPSAVTVGTAGCSITVNPARQHYSFTLGSATCGLQEAINYAHGLPYMIITPPDWARLGCDTSVITSAKGSTPISIIDERTSSFQAYTWNGSAYVPTSIVACSAATLMTIGCVKPDGTTITVAPNGTITAVGTGVSSVAATSPIQVNGGAGPATGAVTVGCPGCMSGSGTTGYVPQWTGSTTLGNSFIDYGVTNSGAYTISKPVIIPSTAQVGLTATTLTVSAPSGASANFAAKFLGGSVLINNPSTTHALDVAPNGGDTIAAAFHNSIDLIGANQTCTLYDGYNNTQGSTCGYVYGLGLQPKYLMRYTAGGGSGGDGSHFFTSTSSASADSGGLNFRFQINNVYTQSGTASGIDLMIRRTETSIGSGVQDFINAAVGDNSAGMFRVDHTGDTHINDGSGHGGTVDMSEGTAPSAALGHDIIYADTSHCIKVSLNGGSFTCLSTTTGTVTSVGLTMPSWFAVGSSPITSSGTIGVTAATGQTSHQVIGTCGTATSVGPCSLVAGDLPTIPAGTGGTGSTTVPTAGQIPVGNAGSTAYAPQTMSGDCTLASTGAVTCTKTNGTSYAASATTDATNASNIGSGTLAAARLPVVPTVVDTSTPVTVSTTNASEFHFNENATAATAVTYNLPTAAAGKQFCFSNAYNGSAANTGVLTIATSASGQFIVFTDGTLSATGGNVTSGGAAADAACVVGVDSTHWMLYVQVGTWTKH